MLWEKTRLDTFTQREPQWSWILKFQSPYGSTRKPKSRFFLAFPWLAIFECNLMAFQSIQHISYVYLNVLLAVNIYTKCDLYKSFRCNKLFSHCILCWNVFIPPRAVSGGQDMNNHSNNRCVCVAPIWSDFHLFIIIEDTYIVPCQAHPISVFMP